MAKGRQLKIYLSDGTVAGIRHAEIVNWTGQALSAPRSRVKELQEWQETQKPGIYFLLGQDEETGNSAVYIGETENVFIRIQQHLTQKDFWNEVICFTSKDENLTKAHVKYLESRLIELSLAAKRYRLENGNQPPGSSLPRGERDAMEEFIDNVRILLGSLGHRLLEPLVKLQVIASANDSDVAQATVLTLKGKKLNAKALLTDEGIVVLAGSEASTKANPSLSNGYTKIRDNLIEESQLTVQGTHYIATEDILFTSSSQAAAILLGYPCNGLDYWLDSDGKSLKQRAECDVN